MPHLKKPKANFQHPLIGKPLPNSCSTEHQ